MLTALREVERRHPLSAVLSVRTVIGLAFNETFGGHVVGFPNPTTCGLVGYVMIVDVIVAVLDDQRSDVRFIRFRDSGRRDCTDPD
jgi:hypothetical protein